MCLYCLHSTPVYRIVYVGVGDSLESVEGTASRDLWKLSCWEMAKDVRKRVNETENDKNFSFLQSFYSVHEKQYMQYMQL